MADLENPIVGHDDGLVADATAERDERSECGMVFNITCTIGALMVVCLLLVLLFYRALLTAGLGGRILAAVVLVLGSMGLVIVGCCCCVAVATHFIYGNPEGRQQPDEEAPPQG
jgi:hypothetical protein